MPDSIQHTYSPTDHTFEWTEDSQGTWYKFDEDEGRKLALAARREEAAKLRKQGYTVKVRSMGRQLLSFGGIGSGNPHIELWTTCFMLNAWK